LQHHLIIFAKNEERQDVDGITTRIIPFIVAHWHNGCPKDNEERTLTHLYKCFLVMRRKVGTGGADERLQETVRDEIPLGQPLCKSNQTSGNCIHLSTIKFKTS
jgi:hypothetical protein